MLKLSPTAKTGALYIKPDWRYEALVNPAKYNLQAYTTIPKDNDSCLHRYLSGGLAYEINYRPPIEINRYLKLLSPEQAKKLYSLWERSFKRSNLKKLNVDTDPVFFKNNVVWNLSKIKEIKDSFLIILIEHVSNYKYNEAIQHAFELFNSKEHDEIVKFIGYCFYAKIVDSEIAKRWNIPVKVVTALKLLFFDFSNFPKDRLANFTYLRQLVMLGLISEIDFSYYKRVYELGELGLKAQTDFCSLTKDERVRVEEYLGKSIIANTMNINFNVRTQRDANNYGNVISNLANYYIKEAEITYFTAKTKNLEASTRRIEGDLIGASTDMNSLDEELLAILRQNSLQDDIIEYKTLDSLK